MQASMRLGASYLSASWNTCSPGAEGDVLTQGRVSMPTACTENDEWNEGGDVLDADERLPLLHAALNWRLGRPTAHGRAAGGRRPSRHLHKQPQPRFTQQPPLCLPAGPLPAVSARPDRR